MTHNIVFGILYLFNIQNLLYIFLSGKTAKEDNLYGLSNSGCWLLVGGYWLLVSGSFKQQRICNKQQETNFNQRPNPKPITSINYCQQLVFLQPCSSFHY